MKLENPSVTSIPKLEREVSPVDTVDDLQQRRLLQEPALDRQLGKDAQPLLHMDH